MADSTDQTALNDPTLYDLVLNTSRLGFDGACELIVARARSLGW